MKDILKFAAVIAVVGGAAFGFISLEERKGYGLKPGTAAPGFRLPALTGGTAELAALRGRVVLLNFWATWCPPCVDEMPSLERLHRTLGPEGLVVVTVSVDSDEKALREFVTRHQLTLPVLRDPSARTANAYRATGYPESFVIAPDGTVMRTVVGPAEWDTPQSLAYFRSLLPRRGAMAPSTSPAR